MLRIKLWRFQNHLTQEDAAAQLGLGLSTLALLESGRLRPTASQIELLRRSFGPDVETLFDQVKERIGANE